jgi:hypothetical protein
MHGLLHDAQLRGVMQLVCRRAEFRDRRSDHQYDRVGSLETSRCRGRFRVAKDAHVHLLASSEHGAQQVERYLSDALLLLLQISSTREQLTLPPYFNRAIKLRTYSNDTQAPYQRPHPGSSLEAGSPFQPCESVDERRKCALPRAVA